jgi:hypothetical protein
MSVATPFNYYQPFPFCPDEFSPGGLPEAFIDNLTLAQVMALWWNLENVEITAGGVTGIKTISGSIQLNPAEGTGDFTGEVNGAACSMWDSIIAGVGDVHEPRDRVCTDVPGVVAFYIDGPGVYVWFEIVIGASATYPGRYVASLNLSIIRDGSVAEGNYGFILSTSQADLGYWDPVIPFTLVGNEISLTIGGISFTAYAASWWQYYEDGDPIYAEGSATASATSVLFTYV